MRRPAPDERPVALTVAGSDSGGGAGIQADLKTMDAHGVFGTSAITAATAQNTTGVQGTHVLPVEQIDAQIDAVVEDFDVGAIKTGMLATAPVIDLVAEQVAASDAPAVVDPVMVASSGDRLLDADAEDAYEDLIARSRLVTPNADEAEVLTGRPLETVADARAAGEALVELGADAALVKGGHLDADAREDAVVDLLVTEESAERFEHPRIDTDATHGSGCTLSSAVAARLARGESLRDAVAEGVSFMERAVRYHYDVGEGPGAVNHGVARSERADRAATAEAIEEVLDRLVDSGAHALAEEGGLQIVGATPYAERPSEVAGVEGGVGGTRRGLRANRGVRFGVADDEATVLLGVREIDPATRFAATVRSPRAVAAVDDLDWERAIYRAPDGSAARSASDAVETAVDDADGTPTALLEERTRSVTVLAERSSELAERTLALADELDRTD
ncbi:hydroxymethylpyrimidine/phosphomethylpyrimidine kinase [Natronoarchaeum philippinense]|uniref:Hydroxymethylpyrimidine/phosphomethylpyrimidine kinase n=1 Tax=Natronoarchaeum philippinense TaxID=558529 RepID=A0A285NSK9_NATPI|nr:bifunctional hydroxymethylpyrimidine kinase/phosphomethylpyrimidine kinase [Natronoarchaeum philippinense]SNZ12482.1 hydroxymethylpyrimidine/phosphomethylpyrimidine kinase [Natronoarchaeum philippinense]